MEIDQCPSHEARKNLSFNTVCLKDTYINTFWDSNTCRTWPDLKSGDSFYINWTRGSEKPSLTNTSIGDSRLKRVHKILSRMEEL